MPRKYPLPPFIEPKEIPPYRLSCVYCGRGNRLDPHGDLYAFRIMHFDGCPALALIASGRRSHYAATTIPAL